MAFTASIQWFSAGATSPERIGQQGAAGALCNVYVPRYTAAAVLSSIAVSTRGTGGFMLGIKAASSSAALGNFQTGDQASPAI